MYWQRNMNITLSEKKSQVQQIEYDLISFMQEKWVLA